MKKILLTSVLILVITCLRAQTNFHKAYQNQSEAPNPLLIEINGDTYFTSQIVNIFSPGVGHLFRHSASGALKSYSQSFAGRYISLGFKTKDNKLVFFGSNIRCDATGSTQQNYIQKLDTNGATTFSTTDVLANGDDPKAALQYSDSSYYIFTNSFLIIHDKNGQFVSKTNTGLTAISSAIQLANNNLLVSAQLANVNSLVELSPAGLIISSQAFPVLLIELSFYNGQKIMARGSDNKVYKISPTFNLITSSSIISSLSVNKFVLRNDSVFSLLYSGSGYSSYVISDTSFNVLYTGNTLTQNLRQVALLLKGSKALVLSSGIANSLGSNHTQYFVSYDQMDLISANNFKYDLALLSVTADSAYIQNITGGSGYFGFMRPRFLVKNRGTSPINEFLLNCDITIQGLCGLMFYQQKFSGLNLLPGDSIVLVASGFSSKYGLNPKPNPNLINFCFHTTLPNAETDKTFADNQLCINLNYSTLGLITQSLLDEAISVMPNPFNDHVNINSDVRIKRVTVYDAIGQFLFESSANENQIDLDLSRWSSGLYFITLETDKGNTTKKLLKN